MQADLARMVREAVSDLEQKKRSLELEIEKLERRRDRIDAEMKTSFAGASQDLAVRVQSFKEYLVGSLQDLATSAEQLQLTIAEPRVPRQDVVRAAAPEPEPPPQSAAAVTSRYLRDTERIQSLLDQYRLRPDYYGPIWQLRRTFEPIHADRIANWFFSQGGRGAIKTLNSRLQNVLMASAAISVLHTMHGDRLRVLVLANSPERLGDWRRGFQDCLGVSRADFGTRSGIMLFESSEPMAQRAERLLENNYLPFIIIDESEGMISLSVLQFPLWLAIAPDPANPTSDYYDFQ
ncbi:DUF3086 domain-containing protein [Oscillatoria sp. CS-180]|uniref:DUF3086 domain-containing protein n=1 Tax=Oscillatoria sp. CS-180 TaxID=3021720 RepID=UPI00233030B7|nr:DUF3086 domain-containing protein [Oscillatoria sp. CS-180]MDB9528996.1 DUF3086 domain-containing protein [Oscillatoria sp. CS-180]